MIYRFANIFFLTKSVIQSCNFCAIDVDQCVAFRHKCNQSSISFSISVFCFFAFKSNGFVSYFSLSNRTEIVHTLPLSNEFISFYLAFEQKAPSKANAPFRGWHKMLTQSIATISNRQLWPRNAIAIDRSLSFHFIARISRLHIWQFQRNCEKKK